MNLTVVLFSHSICLSESFLIGTSLKSLCFSLPRPLEIMSVSWQSDTKNLGEAPDTFKDGLETLIDL